MKRLRKKLEKELIYLSNQIIQRYPALTLLGDDRWIKVGRNFNYQIRLVDGYYIRGEIERKAIVLHSKPIQGNSTSKVLYIEGNDTTIFIFRASTMRYIIEDFRYILSR